MQGTIDRLVAHGLHLAQVSAHHAADFCIYYENVVVSIGPDPHPDHPPLSAIQGGPPFHPNCVHTLRPFVERFKTPAQLEASKKIDATVLDRKRSDLQRRFRAEFPKDYKAERERLQAQARKSRQRAEKREARQAAKAPPIIATPIKGGYAANGQTVTAIGQLGEKAAQKIGLLPFAEAAQTYTRPCDFRLDGTHAVEVKTFTASNADPKIRMVPAAHKRKMAFANAHNLKPKTVAVHLSADLKSAIIYQREGFENYRLKNIKKIAEVTL